MRIVLEIGLALVTLVAGMLWWQLRKRNRFLRQIVRDEAYLRQIISRELFRDPPARILPYLRLHSLIGHLSSFDAVTKADIRSQRSAKLSSWALLAAVAAVSLYLGQFYFVINGAVFCVSGFGPIDDSARFNATEHVLTWACILHRWHLDNPTECSEFIASAKTLQPLYRAVKAASD